MSAPEKLVKCGDVAPLLVFYVCDEVDTAERARIAAHVAECKVCAAQLAEEQALSGALAEVRNAADYLDPSGILLSQCRSELSEKLDDMAAPPLRPSWHPFSQMRKWMALRPALSAAALVMFGLALGAQTLQWYEARNGNAAGTPVNISAAPRISDDQLAKMSLSAIRLMPAPDAAAPGAMQLQLHTEQPFVLSGNVEDSDVRRVLTYVVENGERFDPGVRLDCLEALKPKIHDAQVRGALMAAARKDQNPAVRMKALESLRDAAGDEAVRETLLDALEHDPNPGVRVEAVNLLVRSLGAGVPDLPEVTPLPAPEAIGPEAPSVARVMRTLEELQRRDPNRYVRLRSAAALRQIAPRELQ